MVLKSTQRWIVFLVAAYQKHMAWLPYLVLCLLVWGHTSIRQLGTAMNLAQLVVGKMFLLAAGALVVGYMLLGTHLWLCFYSSNRRRARFTLVYAIVLIVLALVCLELLLPVKKRYTPLQANCQRQLARRLKNPTTSYRGMTIQMPCNGLGWADKERSFTKTTDRVVFIGDSFLEMRSWQPLSLRVEALLDNKIELINLSLSATNPQQDYRFRLHEFALAYHPNHIFLFVYELNDLTPGYTFRPYRHPAYRISDEAVSFLNDVLHDPKVVEMLVQLKRDRTVFCSKADLLNHVQRLAISLNDQHLIYLASLAYAQPTDKPPAFMLPNVRKRINKLVQGSIEGLRSLAEPGRQPVQLAKIVPQYKAILKSKAPRAQRLERIAKLVGQTHYGQDDDQPFLDVLHRQDESFITQLLAYPDEPSYLAAALGMAVGCADQREVNPDQAQQTVDQYLKLYREFAALAALNGVELTVVLIPDAHRVDQAFLKFWAPLTDFRGCYPFDLRRAQFDLLRQKLPQVVTTIDLTDYADQLSGAYWPIDGHWTPKGNSVVAKIIGDHLRQSDEASSKNSR